MIVLFLWLQLFSYMTIIKHLPETCGMLHRRLIIEKPIMSNSITTSSSVSSQYTHIIFSGEASGFQGICS
jgi:hypothetical protein